MEEKQLARYRFFRRAGIFSIDRENPRSAMESLRYAAGLLAGRSRVLWLFPQGVILPNDRRPIDCSPGAAHLVGMLPKCTIAPVAFRYELLGEERPFAWVSIGEPIAIRSERRGSTRDLTAQIATILTAEADALRDDVVSARTGEFTDIIRSRRNREWRMEN
jgi:1-acyl-sn-glycerol-3-phosphate acyltransferase